MVADHWFQHPKLTNVLPSSPRPVAPAGAPSSTELQSAVGGADGKAALGSANAAAPTAQGLARGGRADELGVALVDERTRRSSLSRRSSIGSAIEELSALSVAGALLARTGRPEHSAVDFAQILGMADDLTFSLGLDGFNAHKLVPYGAFEELLPWLLRRLEENHDALGAAAEERPLLRRELARRVAGAVGL